MSRILSQLTPSNLNRRDFCTAVGATCLGLTAGPAFQSLSAAESSRVRLIAQIPWSESDLRAAHEQSGNMACELVPRDEPFEISSFTSALSERDPGAKSRDLADPSSRRHAFSVGLDVMKDDQAKLPDLSRSLILKYLEEHYVAVQVRVQKDLVDGTLCLGARPFAATANFRVKQRLTTDFVEAVSTSVQQFHSLGLFWTGKRKPRPLDLRTLVLLHRNDLFVEDPRATGVRVRPNFEYVFIRARTPPAGTKDAPALILHAFATADQRKTLHYLHTFKEPTRIEECNLRGTVVFTDFSHADLYPTAAAIRRIHVRSRARLSWDLVEAHAKKSGWSGPARDHLTQLLDDIIDGALKAE